MDTICADLSPFYLARARSNVRYWKSQKAPSLELGGADGAGAVAAHKLLFRWRRLQSTTLCIHLAVQLTLPPDN